MPKPPRSTVLLFSLEALGEPDARAEVVAVGVDQRARARRRRRRVSVRSSAMIARRQHGRDLRVRHDVVPAVVEDEVREMSFFSCQSPTTS